MISSISPQRESELEVNGIDQQLIAACHAVLDCKLQQLEKDIASRTISDSSLCNLLKEADEDLRAKVANYLARCVRSCDYQQSIAEIWHDIDYDDRRSMITDITSTLNPHRLNPEVYLVVHELELHRMVFTPRQLQSHGSDHSTLPKNLIEQLCSNAESCDKLFHLYFSKQNHWCDFESVVKHLAIAQPHYLLPWSERLVQDGTLSDSWLKALYHNVLRYHGNVAFYLSSTDAARLATLSARSDEASKEEYTDEPLSFKARLEFDGLIAKGKRTLAQHMTQNFHYTRNAFESYEELAKFLGQVGWDSIPVFAFLAPDKLSSNELKTLTRWLKQNQYSVVVDETFIDAETLSKHGLSRLVYEELLEACSPPSELMVAHFVEKHAEIGDWLGVKRRDKLEQRIIREDPISYALALLHNCETTQGKSVGTFLQAQNLLLEYPLEYTKAMPQLWQLASHISDDKELVAILKAGLRAQGDLACLKEPSALLNAKFAQLQYPPAKFAALLENAILTSTDKSFLADVANQLETLPENTPQLVRQRHIQAGDIIDLILILPIDNKIFSKQEIHNLAMREVNVRGLSVFNERPHLLTSVLGQKNLAKELVHLAEQPLTISQLHTIAYQLESLRFSEHLPKGAYAYLDALERQTIGYMHQDPKLLLNEPLRTILSDSASKQLLGHYASFLVELDPGIYAHLETTLSLSANDTLLEHHIAPLIFTLNSYNRPELTQYEHLVERVCPLTRAKNHPDDIPLADKFLNELVNTAAYSWYKDELLRENYQAKKKAAKDELSSSTAKLPAPYLELGNRIAFLETSPIIVKFKDELTDLDRDSRTGIEDWCLLASSHSFAPCNADICQLTLSEAVDLIKTKCIERMAVVWPKVATPDLSVLPPAMWNDLLLYSRLVQQNGFDVLDPFQDILGSLSHESFTSWRSGISENSTDLEVQSTLEELQQFGRLPATLTAVQYQAWCKELPLNDTPSASTISSRVCTLLAEAVNQGELPSSELSENLAELQKRYYQLATPLKELIDEKHSLTVTPLADKREQKVAWQQVCQKIHEYSTNYQSQLEQVRARSYLHSLMSTPDNILCAGNVLVNGTPVSQAIVFKTLLAHYKDPASQNTLVRLSDLLVASRGDRAKRASSGSYILTAVDSVEPQLLFSLGQKPVTTCQNFNGRDSNALGLLSTFIEPANRVVWAYDSRNEPVGRCIIRIMHNERGQPVIFAEKIYRLSDAEEIEATILQAIAAKAELMNLVVYAADTTLSSWFTKQLSTTLTSINSRIATVHSDAGGGLHRSNSFTIERAYQLDLEAIRK
jgi:hypothetical protein